MTEDVPADGTLPCVQVVLLITDYLDDALSAADRARLDEHLAECDGCGTVLEQFRTTVALTGQLSRDDLDQVPAAPRDALLGAFRAWAAERPPA